MKCRFCGKDLPEDELICPNCGQEVQEPEEVDSQEIDKEIEQEKSKKEPKKIGLVKKIALIAAAVVIGLAAGVGLATLVFGGPAPTAGKVDYAQSNLNNGGRFAFADGAIYYIAQDDAADEEDDSSTATGIIKQAGEEKEKILSMDQLSYLNIYQGSRRLGI